MSHFDKLYNEAAKIRQTHFTQNAVGSFAVALLACILIFGPLGILISIPVAIFGGLFLHGIRKAASSSYAGECSRLAILGAEAEKLKKRVAEIYHRYPRRKHGERFKDAYELRGLSLHRLEEALAVGMHHEQREIFVTCFMRQGIAERVTATIGSPRRCSNSDDIAKWRNHFHRLGCDEILQYHNHPVTHNKTEPSQQDFHTTRYFTRILGDVAPSCHSLLLYWNQALEWRVIEYDDAGQHRLIREFDITKT